MPGVYSRTLEQVKSHQTLQELTPHCAEDPLDMRGAHGIRHEQREIDLRRRRYWQRTILRHRAWCRRNGLPVRMLARRSDVAVRHAANYQLDAKGRRRPDRRIE